MFVSVGSAGSKKLVRVCEQILCSKVKNALDALIAWLAGLFRKQTEPEP